MLENDLAKYAKTQTRCAIAGVVTAILGLPPAYYCALVAYQTRQSAGSEMTIPRHFDIAFGLLIFFYVCAVLGGTAWLVLGRKRKRAAATVAAATSPESLEQTIEAILSRRGVATDQPQHIPQPAIDIHKPADPIFDGDVQLIAACPKHPFAKMTRELMQVMKIGTDFGFDTDIVVKVFIVNTSSERQYARDICASVEIDGKRVEMIRQMNFDAFEYDGMEYEYCLDPTPGEPLLLLEHRAETLEPVSRSFPVEMDPRKPIEGWIRFLLEHVDYEKLDKNFSYEFYVEDSMGKRHPITRASDKKVRGVVTVRRKGQ